MVLGIIYDSLRKKPIMIGTIYLAFISLVVIVYLPINTFILYLIFMWLGIDNNGHKY